jgi:hypothetical protein
MTKLKHLTPLALAAGLACAALAAAAPVTSDKSPLNLIPWPKAVQMGSGGMALKAAARIVTADDRLLPLAGIFKAELYKLDELKALVKYADERGVTLVPELETPGHSGNACGTLPECFGFIDPVTGKAVGQSMMNIANPKLYETLDTIIGEMYDGILIRGGEWGAPEVMTLGPKDLEVVIDLGKSTAINQVVARFVYLQEGGILPAVRVDVAVSNDGKTYKPVGTTSFELPNNRASRGLTMKELAVATKGSGRFVKVFCKNNGVLPAWHEYPGVPDHMMMDEILVNP